jgi:type IV secretion system protein VirD4
LKTRPTCLAYVYYDPASPAWCYAFLMGSGVTAVTAFFYMPALPPVSSSSSDVFGDAHWASLEEVKKSTRLLDGLVGIPLGYAKGGGHWRKVTYAGDRHLVTIAPNRSGKGVTSIIPTLLEYVASCAITARQRQRLGHKVIILNPFHVLGRDFAALGFTRFHRFNPLARLNSGANDFVAGCARIAEALVFNESKDPHWSDSARSLVECVIMHVCTEPGEKRSLGRMRELITMGEPAAWTRLLATMANSSYQPLRQKISQFLATNNEMQSILSTARIQTKDLDDPAIAESLSDSDFSFIDLKRRKMTVYLVLAGENMGPYRRWLRLLLTSALNELMGSAEKGEQPVLFLLDEFATLGNLSVLEDNMAYFAGFGIQLWSIVQDVNQLEALYEKRWQSFVANAGVLQCFTPNDQNTAKYISERCGPRTVTVPGRSTSSSTNPNGGQSTSQSTSESVHSAQLIYPHELYGFSQNLEILFHSGMAYPFPPYRFSYREPDKKRPGVADYTGLYDENPYYRQSQNGAGDSDAGGADTQSADDDDMTETEALDVIGLRKGATPDDIRAAIRRVLQQVHRDHGGSDYFTRKVLKAREVLLGE